MPNYWPVTDAYGNVLAYQDTNKKLTLNPRYIVLHKKDSIFGHFPWYNWKSRANKTTELWLMNLYSYTSNK